MRAADMPGADGLIVRIYAAVAQKARELISKRTRGNRRLQRCVTALGGARGYQPPAGSP